MPAFSNSDQSLNCVSGSVKHHCLISGSKAEKRASDFFLLIFLTIIFVLSCLVPPRNAFSVPRDNNVIRLKRADDYFNNRSYRNAYDKYWEIYASKSASPLEREYAHYKMAESLDLTGEAKLAIKELEKLLEENPRAYKSSARSRLIKLYRQVDQKDKALKLLEVEIKDNPRIMSNYEQLADLYTSLEQYDKALSIYEEMLSRFPTVKYSIEDKLINIYHHTGTLESKIAELKSRSLKEPANDDIHKTLMKYYHYQKKYDQAIAEYSKIKLKNTGFYLQLGRLYFENRQPDQAIAVWRRIIRANPRNLRYYDQVAQVLGEAGFLEEVVKIYQQARKELNNPVLYTMELAHTYEVLGDLRSAMGEYFDYLDRVPQKRYIVIEAIDNAINDGESMAKIIEAIESNLRNNPNRIEANILLGDIFIKQSQPISALRQFLKAVNKSKVKEPVIYRLARKLSARSYYQEAVKLYDELPERDNYKIVYPQMLDAAKAYENVGDYNKSLSILTKIIERPNRDNLTDDAVLQRGQLYFRIAKYLEAVNDFSFVVEITPNSRKKEIAQLGIARCYYYLKDYRKADSVISPLLQSFKPGDNYFELLYLSARVKLFLDKKEESRKILQSLAEKYPQAKAANDALALVRFLQHTPNKYLDLIISALEKEETRDYQGALDIYHQFLQKEPEAKNAESVWLRIGGLYRKLGRMEKAASTYKLIIDKYPDSVYLPKVLFNLAALYEENPHDDAKAIKTYEDLIVKYPDSIYVNEAREKLKSIKTNVTP